MLFERVEHTKIDRHLLLPNVIENIIIQYMIRPNVNQLMLLEDSNAVKAKTNLVLRSRCKGKYR